MIDSLTDPLHFSVCKLGFAAYLLAFWAQNLAQYSSSPDDVVLSVLLVTLTVLLMGTQMYACLHVKLVKLVLTYGRYGASAVWGLASKVDRSISRQNIVVGSPHPSTLSVAVPQILLNVPNEMKEEC